MSSNFISFQTIFHLSVTGSASSASVPPEPTGKEPSLPTGQAPATSSAPPTGPGTGLPALDPCTSSACAAANGKHTFAKIPEVHSYTAWLHYEDCPPCPAAMTGHVGIMVPSPHLLHYPLTTMGSRSEWYRPRGRTAGQGRSMLLMTMSSENMVWSWFVYCYFVYCCFIYFSVALNHG